MAALLLAGLPLLAAATTLEPLQFALAPPQDVLGDGFPTSNPAVIPLGDATAGAAFADGTFLVAVDNGVHHFSSDFSVRLASWAVTSVSHMQPHPDGSVLVTSYSGVEADTIYKFESTGSVLSLAASQLDSSCKGPSVIAVQRTNSQRVFVMMTKATAFGFCQYDADLAGPSHTSTALMVGLDIAPDDSFLIARFSSSLQKFTINDGAGSVTAGASYAFSGTTLVSSLVVLADYRILVPSPSSNELDVIGSSFSSDSAVALDSGNSCSEPYAVATDQAGTGDIFVLCRSSNTLVILNNALSTTVELLPSDLGLYGTHFGFAPSQTSVEVNVANTAGSLMFVGGDSCHGFAFLNMTGAGTAGLAGSYATPAAAAPQTLGNTFALSGVEVVGLQSLSGVGVFADGTILVGNRNQGYLALLSSDMGALLDSSFDVASPSIIHAHPDGSMIVLDTGNDGVFKFTASANALSQTASSSDSGFCNDPVRVASQRTGFQRIFVICVNLPAALCQYNADLSGRTCTSLTLPRGVAVAPDDTYVVIRDNNTLQKYVINNELGTLTPGATLDISMASGTSVFSLTVLFDHRIVVPDEDFDELEVANAAFDTVTTIDVNNGTLGGITPSCEAPEVVTVHPAGTGDVYVGCDGTNSLLILSNDLSTTALQPTFPVHPVFNKISLETSTFSGGVGVADAAGTLLGVSGSNGFALLDMAGAGSAGLAGSYASPTGVIDMGNLGVPLGPGARYAPINEPAGMADFPDGTLGVAMAGDLNALLLTSSDLLTVHDVVLFSARPQHVVRHPDGSALVVVTSEDTVYKYTATGGVLTEAATFSDASVCNGPYRVTVQQTGNQRIFVTCVDEPDALCQLDADLTNHVCTGFTNLQGAAVAPSDAFLAVRAENLLHNFDIIDASGTLSLEGTLALASATYDSYYSAEGVYGMAVLADNRVVIPDATESNLEVVDLDQETVTTINLDPLGCSAEEVAAGPSGSGDVLVLCHSFALVLSNDLSTTTTIHDQTSFNVPERVLFGSSSSVAKLSVLSNGEMFLGTQGFLRVTGTSLPGAGGDPVLVDFAGHRFLAGHAPNTEYRMLEFGRDTLTVTTGTGMGPEYGYFIVAATLTRAGCGSATITAVAGAMRTSVNGDECARLALALGDNGLVALGLENGAGVVAVKPHASSKHFSFLNVKLVFVSDTLRTGCKAGMLCNEEHREEVYQRV